MKRPKLYHDNVLAENVSVSAVWQDIELNGSARVERDRQMVGLRLKEPAGLDYHVGELTLGNGRLIQPELRLIDRSGTSHQLRFSTCRGTQLAGFRPDEALNSAVELVKLQLRCDIPFEADRIIWTTYSIRDMK